MFSPQQIHSLVETQVNPLRVIISGGPGTGKSTLLDGLKATGELCFPEVSRDLIREQFRTGGSLLPWKDLAGFAAECAERMGAQLAASSPSRRAFFDRGLPDLIAYLRHGGCAPFDRLHCKSRQYTPIVFLAPPWREIYVNDAERPQSYLESVALHPQIVRAYRECEFDIQVLPCVPVASRVHFVLTRLTARSSFSA